MATASNNTADGGIERALAQGVQDAVKKPGTLDTTGTKAFTFIGASPTLKAPKASAYAVNIDPMAVDWSSLGSRTVTLDLTGIQLQALTSGPGSLAAATDIFSGAVRDGVTDVMLPQDGAFSLFTLSLGVFDAGNLPATALVGLSDPGGLPITDSEGGSGLAGVLADLAASFVPEGAGIY